MHSQQHGISFDAAYQFNINPNWIERAAPVPKTGLGAA